MQTFQNMKQRMKRVRTELGYSKRYLQTFLLFAILVFSSAVVIGCKKKNTQIPSPPDSNQQESNIEGEDSTNTEDSNGVNEVIDDAGEEEKNDEVSGDDSNDSNQQVEADDLESDEQAGEQDAEAEQSTETGESLDPFLLTEEGANFQQVASEFAVAYLNGQDEVAQSYVAKDVNYDSVKGEYSSVELVDLRLYSYDEESKECFASYAFIGNGEDSYTYLSMELIYDGDTYRVSMFGLEK